MKEVATPPCKMKSSMRRPTSLSAKAVQTAVRNPKQRRSPRATLYSPPPSQTWNCRAVRILPSPGSSRSMISPRASRSYWQPLTGLRCRRATGSYSTCLPPRNPAEAGSAKQDAPFRCVARVQTQSRSRQNMTGALEGSTTYRLRMLATSLNGPTALPAVWRMESPVHSITTCLASR